MLKNSKLLEKNTSPIDMRSFKIQYSHNKSFQNYKMSPTNVGKQNVQYLHSIDTKKIRENQEINHLASDVKPKPKYDSSMINNRLQQIKRKYDSQRMQMTLNSGNHGTNPLEESHKINNYPQIPTKIEKQYIPLSNKIKQRSHSTFYEQRNKIRADSIQKSKLFQTPANLYREGLLKEYNLTNPKETSNRIQYKYAPRFLEKSICDQVRESKILNESESKYKYDRNQRDSEISDLSSSKYNQYSRKFTIDEKSKPKEQQRIDSIDKINLKIKQILKCLNENEKKSYLANYPQNPNTDQKKQFQQPNPKRSYITEDIVKISEFKSNKDQKELSQKNKLFYKGQINPNKFKDSYVREGARDSFLAESFRRDSFNQDRQILNSKVLNNNFISKDYSLKNPIKQSTVTKQSFLKNSFAGDIENKQILNKDINKLDIPHQKNSFINNNEAVQKNDNIQKNNLADKIKEQIRKSSIYEKYAPRLEQKSDFTVQRSSSAITKSRNNTSNECRLSSGKDLDEEIRKIQDKIRKSEQEKKKLNIKFQAMKQYNYKDRSVQKNLNQSKLKQSILNNTQQPKKADTSQKLFLEDKFSQISILKPFQSHYKNTTTNVTPFQKSSVKQKEPNQDLRISSIDQKKNLSRNETPSKKYQKIQKNYYENAKLTRIDTKEIQKVETKRLIENLKNQVNLDEELRGSKLMFSLIKDSQQKWKQLRSQLTKHNINLCESDLQKEFELTFEQHNPFYAAKQTSESIQSIASKYANSYYHWINNIKNKFNTQQLTNENFKLEKIDLQRKGHLTVEDFVRFLNIETGTFYRNRDIVLLFRRFTKQPTIAFNQFLEIISKNLSL